MMRTGSAGRLWVLGGILTAAALLAVGWFLFIGPQHARTSSLRDEAAAARSRTTALQHRLTELQQQNDDLARYRAQLESYRQALPTTSGLPDFLRALQTIAGNTRVTVTALNVGAPTQVSAAGTEVYSLPISLTATGVGADVNRFLEQLQQGQPRAVLVSSANLTASDKTGSITGPVSLALNVQVFVAPATGAGKALPAASLPAAPSPAASLPAGN